MERSRARRRRARALATECLVADRHAGSKSRSAVRPASRPIDEAADAEPLGDDRLAVAARLLLLLAPLAGRPGFLTFEQSVGTLIGVLEAKDEYTAQHARDVVDLSERVARRLGLDERALRDVHYAAILHDIGKIGVPTAILRKPGKLTEEEFEQIKTHSDVGGRLLERIPFTRTVAPLVRAIHERYDGGGYPDGLAAVEIPLGARIVGACDAYDAMISDRPYRQGMGHEAAVAELHRCAGTQFDPAVVAALIDEFTESSASVPTP